MSATRTNNFHVETEKYSDTSNLLYKSKMHFSVNFLSFISSVIPYSITLVFPYYTSSELRLTVTNTGL